MSPEDKKKYGCESGEKQAHVKRVVHGNQFRPAQMKETRKSEDDISRC
jgi:hypothetical protein